MTIAADGTFQHEIEEDWRAKSITTTATRRHYVGFAKPITGSATDYGFLSVSSEFSRAVEVR